MKVLGYTHRMVKGNAATDEEKNVLALIEEFTQLSVKAMHEGGFHTPNHRWVVAAGMAFCHNITGDPRCMETIEAYLSEGIDINEEGDYTERSVGIYDAVNNNALIIIAEELNKPELFGHIRHNLKKVWNYVEPDWSASTLASRRQDYGTNSPITPHMWAYLYMAAHDKNPQFAWMAKSIADKSPNDHMGLLTKLMLKPGLANIEATSPMPDSYKVFYPIAGTVRYRHKKLAVTLLRDNSTFMKVQYGGLRVFFKLACNFFAKGRFICQDIKETAKGYQMTSHEEWGYRRPLKGVSNPDWFALPHESREKANWQHHDWNIEVCFDNSELNVIIKTDGTENIPWKLEAILDPGGMLKGDGIAVPGIAGSWAVVGHSTEYSLKGEYIVVQGGLSEHIYGHSMRNADPFMPQQFVIYHTGFTPAQHEVRLRFGEC
jgi:hypothetical protein